MRKIRNFNRKKLSTIGAGVGAALLAATVLGGGTLSMEAMYPQVLTDTPDSGPDAGIRMVPVEGEGVDYWPRWRGPSGQGLVDGSGYPDTWSASENVLA